VAEPIGELDRPPPPRLGLGDLGLSIASRARPLYAPASSTEGPRGSRIAIASRALVWAGSPRPANHSKCESMRRQRPSDASSARSRLTRIARDAFQRLLQTARVVRGCGILLEHRRLLAYIEVVV
jgi:hypothetical protein